MEDRVFLSGSAGRGSSRPGLAGYGSRARRNLHWNRRFSVLATVHRGSSPLGFESLLTNHRILSSQPRSLISSHCLSTLFPSLWVARAEEQRRRMKKKEESRRKEERREKKKRKEEGGCA
jgi:hypothetical protein